MRVEEFVGRTAIAGSGDAQSKWKVNLPFNLWFSSVSCLIWLPTPV
jgi:hypothetical protein